MPKSTIPITSQMLDAAYTYLESLSSMVGMAPEEQVKAVLAHIYQIMYGLRPAEVPAPLPPAAPAWTPPAITIPK